MYICKQNIFILSIKMTSPSLAAIRTSRVDAGQGERALSDRRMNPNLGMCIPHNWEDNMGRPAHPWSVMHTSGECPFDPLHRIDVENAVSRPNYAVYLNAQGISQDADGNNSSMGGVDTLFGAGPGRVEAFNRNPVMQQPEYRFENGSADEAMHNQRVYNNALRRKYNQARFAACGQF